MKWIYTLVLSIIALCCTAQCDISDLTATVGACNADGEFAVTLRFIDTDIDSKQYIVQGNGINYGTLMYNNGIVINDLLGDCTTKFEFVVRDAANPACGEAVEVGTVCCGPCKLEASVKQASSCDAFGNYDVAFEVLNPPVNSQSYTVSFNGMNVGTLNYAGSNQTLSIQHDGSDIAEFIICDSTDTTCCDTIQITSPCVCSIFNARWDVIDCDDQDSTFSFIFDADFQEVSDSFTIAVNSVNYGNFSYSQLPVVIGPFDWEPIKYDFVLADLNNFLCTDFGEPNEIPLCPPGCDWTNTAISYACNADKDLELSIGIDNEGIGVLGYEVVLDGSILDTLYDKTTTYVQMIPGGFCNGAPTLVLNDLYYACDTAITLTDTCCIVPCTITSLIETVDCQTDLLTLEINTDADPSETFTSTLFFGANSEIVAMGTVSDFPLEIDISTYQNGTYVLDVVIDGNLCSEEVQFEIDCPFACNLGSVAISSMNCNTVGQAIVEIDFTSSDTPSNSFNIEDLNGNTYGPFDYNSGPYVLEVPEDCSLAPTFFIEDSVDPTCGTFASLPEPLCCTCDIAFTSIDLANCMDGNFEVTLELTSNSGASSGFDLSGNGTSYGTFFYTASPITLTLAGDCMTIYEFVATDSQDPACMAAIALDEPICCDVDTCAVEIASIMVEPCVGMNAAVILDVVGTAVSDSFTVAGNGGSYGTFAYDQSPITLEVVGDCSTIYEFVVADQVASTCSDDIALQDPICCSVDCSLAITSLRVSTCDGDSATVSLSVSTSGMASDSFALAGNGNTYGQYAYADGTVDIVVDGDCATLYEFVATDLVDGSCQVDTALAEPICCDGSACLVEISNVEVGLCEDGLVDVAVIVNASGATGDSFVLGGNGVIYGNYGYDQSPIVLTIEPDCELEYEFVVTDADDADCNAVFDVAEPICCDTLIPCEITIDDITIGECDGDSVTIRLDVLQSGAASTGFTINGNGINYGTYGSQEEVNITVAGDCSTIYEFVVTDLNDAMCSDVIELEEPLCCDTTTSCQLDIVDVVVGDCEDGVYVVTFAIEGEGLGTTLTLSLGSTVVDALLTSDDTYTVGPIMGGDTVTYTLMDPVSGCSDSFTVTQDCLTSVGEELIPETIIYSVDRMITWRASSTWWTDAYVYTLDGQMVAQVGEQANQVEVSQSGLYIVELRSDTQRMVEKVLVVSN
jgi:hypothetical protein